MTTFATLISSSSLIDQAQSWPAFQTVFRIAIPAAYLVLALGCALSAPEKRSIGRRGHFWYLVLMVPVLLLGGLICAFQGFDTLDVVLLLVNMVVVFTVINADPPWEVAQADRSR